MFSQYLVGQTMDAYKAGVAELKRRAMRELGLPESEIIVRDLRPEDIGLSTPQWTITPTADVWNDYVSTSVADQRFLLINGVHKVTAYVSQLRITREGKTSAIWNIQANPSLRDCTTFFEPVIIDQNTLIRIEAYGITASAEKLALLGAVCEPRGLVVNP